MVRIRFGGHWPNSTSNIPGHAGSNLSELGLAEKGLRIIPSFHYQELVPDDYGGHIPAELLWNLADVIIDMDLVHYDTSILAVCLSESMAGGGFAPGNEGTLAPAGQPMGAGLALLASGNHYMSLNITSPILAYPWRFRSTCLAEYPMVLPLGTKRSIVQLRWRAIPYSPHVGNGPGGEIISSGIVLFDHGLDL